MGIVSDRCELNRQIRADNKLLRELKKQVQKLMKAVKENIPALASALETLRDKHKFIRQCANQVSFILNCIKNLLCSICFALTNIAVNSHIVSTISYLFIIALSQM